MAKKKKSWRTTLLGVITLAVTGAGIAANPASLADTKTQAATIAQIAAGVGLIAAKDESAEPTER